MAGYGVPEADIGKVLDIDVETLRLHYRRELEASSVRINAKVAESLSQGNGGRPRGSHRSDILAKDTCALEGDERA
jgi:hypothetical protein